MYMIYVHMYFQHALYTLILDNKIFSLLLYDENKSV